MTSVMHFRQGKKRVFLEPHGILLPFHRKKVSIVNYLGDEFTVCDLEPSCHRYCSSNLGKRRLVFFDRHGKNAPNLFLPELAVECAWIFERRKPDKPGNFYICDVVKGHPIAAHMSTKITNHLFQYRSHEGLRLIFNAPGK